MSVRQLAPPTFVALVLVALVSSSAQAQDATAEMSLANDSGSAVAVAPVAKDVDSEERAIPRATGLPGMESSSVKRPSWILPIHVLTASVQGLDTYSTIHELSNHRVEANPLLKDMTGNRAAFVAVKAGVAAAVIYATDRLSRHHPVRAALAAATVNTVYLTIAANNYRKTNGGPFSR